jgi:hypothetical protein
MCEEREHSLEDGPKERERLVYRGRKVRVAIRQIPHKYAIKFIDCEADWNVTEHRDNPWYMRHLWRSRPCKPPKTYHQSWSCDGKSSEFVFSSWDLSQLSAFRKKCAVVQVSEGAAQKTKADGENFQGRLLDGKTVGAIHNRQNFGEEIDEPDSSSSHDGHQKHNGLSE